MAQNKFVVTSRRASSGTFSTTVGQNNMCLLCDKVVHNMESKFIQDNNKNRMKSAHTPDSVYMHTYNHALLIDSIVVLLPPRCFIFHDNAIFFPVLFSSFSSPSSSLSSSSSSSSSLSLDSQSHPIYCPVHQKFPLSSYLTIYISSPNPNPNPPFPPPSPSLSYPFYVLSRRLRSQSLLKPNNTSKH